MAAAFQIALAEAIAQLNPEAWDRVVTSSGRFLSRDFLSLLEAHLPANLATHYALIHEGTRPVAAVVAQSLDIRAADLSGCPDPVPGFWHAVGAASQAAFASAWQGVLLVDDLLLWPGREPPRPERTPDLWPHLRHLLQAAEQWAESSVGWVHLRFLVCGNLLTTGPHGVALAPDEDPARLWPVVLEALGRIRASSPRFDASDVLMVKDLTAAQAGAEAALHRAGLRRFETEPNMILPLKPGWTRFEDCVRDMKSAYRSGIQRVQRELAEAGIVLERLDPDQVAAEAATLHRLYHQVHDRQKLRLATLTEGWLPALARAYPEDFRMVVARAGAGGRPLGFVTVLRDGTTAHGTHVGFDKAAAAEGLPLYTSLVYAGVGQAIELGASTLVLGRTALAPKAQLGARPQPMCGYLRHQSAALNLAVPGILALLPAPDRPPERHPFKQDA